MSSDENPPRKNIKRKRNLKGTLILHTSKVLGSVVSPLSRSTLKNQISGVFNPEFARDPRHASNFHFSKSNKQFRKNYQNESFSSKQMQSSVNSKKQSMYEPRVNHSDLQYNAFRKNSKPTLETFNESSYLESNNSLKFMNLSSYSSMSQTPVITIRQFMCRTFGLEPAQKEEILVNAIKRKIRSMQASIMTLKKSSEELFKENAMLKRKAKSEMKRVVKAINNFEMKLSQKDIGQSKLMEIIESNKRKMKCLISEIENKMKPLSIEIPENKASSIEFQDIDSEGNTVRSTSIHKNIREISSFASRPKGGFSEYDLNKTNIKRRTNLLVNSKSNLANNRRNFGVKNAGRFSYNQGIKSNPRKLWNIGGKKDSINSLKTKDLKYRKRSLRSRILKHKSKIGKPQSRNLYTNKTELPSLTSKSCYFKSALSKLIHINIW